MNRHFVVTPLFTCVALSSFAQITNNYITQKTPASSAANIALQDVLKRAPRSPLPVGHSETPVTIKPASGKGITTTTCGIVTELTLLHRSNEPAMVVLVSQAINTGKTVVLKDLKCLGNGKAVASSATLTPEATMNMNVADRCKLPLAKGRMQGC